MNLKDIIFPKHCLKCGEEGVYICKKCINVVHAIAQICIACKKPSVDGTTHTKCKKKLGIDVCICAFRYEGVIRKAIVSLKYKFAYEIAGELADHFTFYLNSLGLYMPQKVLVVPIPSHKLRKKWRGFNQSEEIGRIIAQKMGWDFDNTLIRIKMKSPQTNLNAVNRAENVSGVFSLKSGKHYLIRQYKCVILFDDVVTTGSTIKEAAKVLKRGGAESVWGMALAL